MNSIAGLGRMEVGPASSPVGSVTTRSDGVDRATPQEKERRVLNVQRMLIEGWHPMRLVQSCMQRWEISERQAWRYLSEARQRNAEECELTPEKRQQLRAEHYCISRNLVQKAVESGDLGTALKALKRGEEVLGLDAPAKTDNARPNDRQDVLESKLRTLTEEQLRILAEIDVGGPDAAGQPEYAKIEMDYEYPDSTEGCVIPKRPENEGRDDV